MKKIFVLLGFVVACMIGVILVLNNRESENVRRMKQEMVAVDKNCPMNMGIMGDLLSIKFDEKAKEVRMYFSLNEDIAGIENLKRNERTVLQSMKLSFSKEESRELLKAMIEAGTGVSITYKSPSTGKVFKVSLSLEDLEEIRENPMTPMEINQMLLDNMLAIENSRCPYSIDEGMEMVRVYDDGENIVYACRIDEEMYDISVLRHHQDDLKQSSIGIFNDPSMKKPLGVMKSLGKGFLYHYYGDTSGKSVDIGFTNAEIHQYL